jgi:hypothetical protein
VVGSWKHFQLYGTREELWMSLHEKLLGLWRFTLRLGTYVAVDAKISILRAEVKVVREAANTVVNPIII